jgi:hypothetical protein
VIRIQLERRSHAPDLSCPKFVCDYCEEPIEDARRGLYVWAADNAAYEAGEPADVFTVHKGWCDHAFCFTRGWHRHDPCTGELAALLVYLARNAGMTTRGDWEKAEEAT